MVTIVMRILCGILPLICQSEEFFCLLSDNLILSGQRWHSHENISGRRMVKSIIQSEKIWKTHL